MLQILFYIWLILQSNQAGINSKILKKSKWLPKIRPERAVKSLWSTWAPLLDLNIKNSVESIVDLEFNSAVLFELSESLVQDNSIITYLPSSTSTVNSCPWSIFHSILNFPDSAEVHKVK